MKKLSQAQITDKLHQDHFPRGPELERLPEKPTYWHSMTSSGYWVC